MVEGGRKVAEVATDLGIRAQTIYTWRWQARIDAGLKAGLSTSEQAELVAALLFLAGFAAVRAEMRSGSRWSARNLL